MQGINYSKHFQVPPHFIDEKVKIKDLLKIIVKLSEYGYTSDFSSSRTRKLLRGFLISCGMNHTMLPP